jgi:pimeloyl-ACP methyl ester carboxylesterase
MPDVPEQTLYDVFSFPLWSQGIYDLLTVKPSIRWFMEQIFLDDVPDAYIDYAYATSHQPGARYAPLYFLSGQLFTRGIYEATYTQLDLPVLVLYNRDPNTSFERLPDLLAENDQWRAERIEGTRVMPHWEQLPETVSQLDSFWQQ